MVLRVPQPRDSLYGRFCHLFAVFSFPQKAADSQRVPSQFVSHHSCGKPKKQPARCFYPFSFDDNTKYITRKQLGYVIDVIGYIDSLVRLCGYFIYLNPHHETIFDHRPVDTHTHYICIWMVAKYRWFWSTLAYSFFYICTILQNLKHLFSLGNG